MTASALSLQNAILALQNFWSKKGCLITQPLNTEVGAGTANPATTLRVLGPEPWSVAYVEPSVRPDDSRYGQNPNRLQTHTQFQVVLKPDPGNPQELYLESLAALGIDLLANDIRFVEDNWASPALGAWGLGWEVWLNGLEITQFTYFQQVGGQTLDPVAVELTYGLERILMAVQGVDHFKDLEYALGVTYGAMLGQTEFEMSAYYLDEANIERNRILYLEYHREARALLDKQLPLPAYLYALKCSHAFNILDARGAVSTAERAKAFGAMRGLVRDCARQWRNRREELGYPLGIYSVPTAKTSVEAIRLNSAQKALGLLEIGVEELPASCMRSLESMLKELVGQKLSQTRLQYSDLTVHCTPRRLAVLIGEVLAQEPEAARQVRGPKASAAWASDKTPTRALEGFLRSQNATLEQIRIRSVRDVQYVFVEDVQVGRRAEVILTELFTQTVLELRAVQNIRWSDPLLSFIRPIRWLTAMYGEVTLPVRASLLQASNLTRSLRFRPDLRLSRAEDYSKLLERERIILSHHERKARILEEARKEADQNDLELRVEESASLLTEIADLVETPELVMGAFENRYLDLPEIILTAVMRKHQRYLPVYKDGRVHCGFITFANGPCDRDLVRQGNERVLRARFEDALFFFKTDLKTSPAALHARLDRLLFEQRLGSFAHRSQRIQKLALKLGKLCKIDPDRAKTLEQAGRLAKFDLASQMVIETPALAGYMANIYAKAAGQSPEVALALEEMESPRGPGQALPNTQPGAILALADRADQLVSLISIDAPSSGSSDPFGQRRIAAGIISLLRARDEFYYLELTQILTLAGQILLEDLSGNPTLENPPKKGLSELVALAREFTLKRWETQLTEEGVSVQKIRGCLTLAEIPHRADKNLAWLDQWQDRPEFLKLVETIKRIDRLIKDAEISPESENRLTGKAEVKLMGALVRAKARQPRGLNEFVLATRDLTPAITAFFDEVLVMDPDLELRQARTSLLAKIRAWSWQFLDWNALQI